MLANFTARGQKLYILLWLQKLSATISCKSPLSPQLAAVFPLYPMLHR
jgi:hypothetical protein